MDLECEALKVGAADKGLTQYFRMLPAMVTAAHDYDVISFDFFDTLFTRLSTRPDDAQSAVGHMLFCEGLLPAGPDFLTLRKQAEANARRIKGRGDVNTTEIYAAWGEVASWPTAAIARAEALEREIETRVLVPRKSVIDLARDLARRGKRLIIISDTYFDAAFIWDILTIHQLTNIFTEIFASSETGYRKDSREANGAVWYWIKTHYCIDGKKFLHIGDNEHSDMQIPCDLGLNAMGLINTGVLADLRKCPMPPAWREARSDWRDGVLLGPLVARVGGDAFAPSLSSAFEFKDARDFGYCILGPIAFAFMSWLYRRAKENRIDRFYFLARGAYFLHELYEELRSLEPGLPASHYLKVSRRAVLPAAFAVSPDPAAVVAGVGGFKGTFGAFLNARLGLSLESPDEDANISIALPCQRELVFELMSKHAECIRTHCSETKHKLHTYLEQENLTTAAHPALVDLGYSATIQKALQTVLGRPMIGCYFGTTPGARDAETAGGIIAACFGEKKAGEQLPDIIRYSILLEAFFAGPTGQVDGYREKDGTVVPAYHPEPENGPAFAQLCEVATGMKAYCLDLVSAYGPAILYADFDNRLALEPFLRLLSGWGGIPKDLRPALMVDDAFCGNDTLDVLAILETGHGIRF